MATPDSERITALRLRVEQAIEASTTSFTAAVSQAHGASAGSLRRIWSNAKDGGYGPRESALHTIAHGHYDSRIADTADWLHIALVAYRQGQWTIAAGSAAHAEMQAHVVAAQLRLEAQMRELGTRVGRTLDPRMPGGNLRLRQVWRDLPVANAVAITETAWRRLDRHQLVRGEMDRLGVGRAVEALHQAHTALDDVPDERSLHLIVQAERELTAAGGRFAARSPSLDDAGRVAFGASRLRLGEFDAALNQPHGHPHDRSATPAEAYEAIRHAGDLMARLCEDRIKSDTFSSPRDLWAPGRDVREALKFLAAELSGGRGRLPLAAVAQGSEFVTEMTQVVSHLRRAIGAMHDRLDWDAAAGFAQRAVALLRTHPRFADGTGPVGPDLPDTGAGPMAGTDPSGPGLG